MQQNDKVIYTIIVKVYLQENMPKVIIQPFKVAPKYAIIINANSALTFKIFSNERNRIRNWNQSIGLPLSCGRREYDKNLSVFHTMRTKYL
jgi:hypothetical protein